MKKPVWKTYQFWTGFSGAAVLVAESIFSLLGKSLFSATQLGETIMAVCALLVVFGIVSKPKEKTEANAMQPPENAKPENQNSTDTSGKT